MEQPASLNMTPDEIYQLTDLEQPAAQLKKLRALGFFLAWRNMKSGRCVLPRAHYLAVCSGAVRAESSVSIEEATPQVLPPPPSRRKGGGVRAAG